MDGFDPSADAPIDALAIQPDGKLLVAGAFSTIGGQSQAYAARLNADGSLDTQFNPGIDSRVRALALQPDGGVLIGGSFTLVGGQPRTGLVRLNADASVDLSFAAALQPGDAVRSIAVQSDGRILVGGSITRLGDQPRSFLGRVNYDGSVDALFNPSLDGPVNSLLALPDGRILAGGEFTIVNGETRAGLVCLNSDGRVYPGFAQEVTGGNVLCLIAQPDGKVVFGGASNPLAGGPGLLGRFHPDGTLDPSFDPNPDNAVTAFTLQADGKIVVGGAFSNLGGQPCQGLGRVQPNGGLDSTFWAKVDDLPRALVQQSDGNIVVAGQFTKLSDVQRNSIGRLYPDGSADATLNPGADSGVIAVALQPDGKIVLGGNFTVVGGLSHPYLARLNPDGNVDSSFNAWTGGWWQPSVLSVIVQPDEKILVGGYFSSLNGVPRGGIGRLNRDGSLDTSFADPGANSRVYVLALQPDGKVVAGGFFTSLGGQSFSHVGRLNSDGTPDLTFTPPASGDVYALALQPDGKILVGAVPDSGVNYLRRLNPDGTLDSTFQGAANQMPFALAVQPDGKILVAGYFTEVDGAIRNHLARLNSDGTLDLSFNPDLASADAFTLALQADGRILVGGYFMAVGGEPRDFWARLNSDGSPDPEFNVPVSGTNPSVGVFALALQADGKIVVGDLFDSVGGQARSCLARVTSGSPAGQSLQVNPAGTAVTWARSGSAPQVDEVSFEQSSDGLSYTSLGTAAWTEGGWQLTGLNLPWGENFYLRARGRAVGGYQNGSSGIIEWVQGFHLNRAPEARTRNLSLTADTNCLADGSVNDGSFDPDAGDIITVSQQPAGPYPVGSTPVTLTVTDHHGASSSALALVTVADTTPPVPVCKTVHLTLDPAGDALTIVPEAIDGGSSDLCGAVTLAASKTTFGVSDIGDNAVILTVTDPSGNQATCTAKVTVSSGNHPPVLTNPGKVQVNESSPVSFTLQASDPDPGQVLHFTIAGGSVAGMTLNEDTGAFSWTTTEADGPGRYTVTFAVTDNGNPPRSSQGSCTISVLEVNQKPVLLNPGSQTVKRGTTLSFALNATDPDLPPNKLTYSIEGGREKGMDVNRNTGVFTWTPQSPGSYAVTFRATDNGVPPLFADTTVEIQVTR